MMSQMSEEDMYKLYERVLKEARPAGVYEFSQTETAWGKTIQTTGRKSGAERDSLPWGEHDKIQKATWYTCDLTSWFTPNDRFAWSLNIGTHGYYPGLSVYADTGLFCEFDPGYTIIGVRGKMKCPDGQGHLAVESEDALVAKVLADISAFYDAFVRHQRMMNADVDDNFYSGYYNRMADDFY